MIIRIVSSKGTKRIELAEQDSISILSKKVQEEFNLSVQASWHLAKSRNGSSKIKLAGTVRSLNIRHGDQLFLIESGSQNGASSMDNADYVNGDSYSIPKSSSVASHVTNKSERSPSIFTNHVEEDTIDKELEKLDGRIHRKMNNQLCRHGSSGKCIHCVPLEPYDENYLEHCDPPIKFMSFHAYQRKLHGGSNKGKFVCLENLSCRIKSGCTDHPPWPEGICTKCQPNALTLSIQKYRHVDYVQFENRYLMERFLDFWRKTGHQRIGYLYGKYARFENAPLGIKAVVSAIYEPPQINHYKSVQLVEVDPKEEEELQRIAQKLGLERVGWIFTDLVADDLTQGTVKHYRGTVNTFFLSAQECITAAYLQNKHPSPCKLSPEGHFGSKFVTVVVTGDASKQIHFEGYQVSNQCMALQRDSCLLPTYDAPELGYIKESSNEQYIPDVFYSMKDKYGNEVTKLGRPLPVEYLLVDMPAAFPIEEQPSLFAPQNSGVTHQFPTEHRQSLGQIQDFPTFAKYMRQFPPSQHLQALSSLHVLFFLSTCDMLPLADQMDNLLGAIKTKDAQIQKQFFDSEEWQTILQLLDATDALSSPGLSSTSALPSLSNASPGPTLSSAPWACDHCTFHNQATSSTCEMCGLPSN